MGLLLLPVYAMAQASGTVQVSGTLSGAAAGDTVSIILTEVFVGDDNVNRMPFRVDAGGKFTSLFTMSYNGR